MISNKVIKTTAVAVSCATTIWGVSKFKNAQLATSVARSPLTIGNVTQPISPWNHHFLACPKPLNPFMSRLGFRVIKPLFLLSMASLYPSKPVQDGISKFGSPALAAVLCFPFFKATAEAQSLVKRPFLQSAMPPYRAVGATVFGMTVGRGVVFYGDQKTRELLMGIGLPQSMAAFTSPALLSASTAVLLNPIHRASVAAQNSASVYYNSPVRTTMHSICKTKGPKALFEGTMAQIYKTAPKYVILMWAKFWMEKQFPRKADSASSGRLRDALISIIASTISAVFENPLCVLRNLKYNGDSRPYIEIAKAGFRELGFRFFLHGTMRNMVNTGLPSFLALFFIFRIDYFFSKRNQYYLDEK